MSIKIKLLILAFYPIMAAIIIGILLYRNAVFVGKELESQEVISEIRNGIFQDFIFRNDFFHNPGERPLVQLKAVTDSFNKLLLQVTGEQTTINKLRENKKYIDGTMLQIVASPSAELEQRLISQIIIKSQENVSLVSWLAEESRVRVTQSHKNTAVYIVMAMTVLVTVFLFVIYFIWLSIAQPLLALKESVARVAALDFTTTTTTTTTNHEDNSEIGELGKIFNQMTARLGEAYLSLKERTGQLDEKIKDLEQTEEAMLNLMEDANKLKETAQQKTQDLQKFELAVENASDQIIITDQDAVVLYANKAVEITTGFLRSEVLGKKAGFLWGKQMETSFYKNMWQTIKIEKKPFSGEINNKRASGEKYIAEINISPVLNEKGEVVYFVGIESDITKAKDIDRMKTEFISLASHQLRTPLSAVKWFAEMLLGGDAGELGEKQKEFVTSISQSNSRMIKLVNFLLNISRIESGRITIAPKPTKLRDLIEIVMAETRAVTEKKDINLSLKIAPEIPEINVDPEVVEQIYLNLLTNALKYTPDKGSVAVQLSLAGETVLSRVSDSGYGIPEAEKSRVFQRFFRGSNIVKFDTEGTGLGLYLVSLLVEASGGKIWFESVQDRGSTFWFSLPLSGSVPKQGEVTLGS